MNQKEPIIKTLWEDLTSSQRDVFEKQMKFAGWKDGSRYPYHVYQLQGGKCFGWIEEYRQQYLKLLKKDLDKKINQHQ